MLEQCAYSFKEGKVANILTEVMEIMACIGQVNQVRILSVNQTSTLFGVSSIIRGDTAELIWTNPIKPLETRH